MFKVALSICLSLASSSTFAAWKIETGKKALSTFPPLVGTLASVPAKSPYKGVTARLQLECFTHPELRGLEFGLILSKAPPNGFMAWRYQYDDNLPIKTKPYSRLLPPESITLGDASSAEVKGLAGAKRLRLTLLPPIPIIAERAGFSGPRRMSAAFARLYGRPPSTLRGGKRSG